MNRSADIRPYAIGISVIMSIWCIYQDKLVNNDGILYLLSAELISQGDWQKALQLYNWLFYSVIIAALDRLTGIGVENIAHILNTIFQALIVYAFISISKEAGGNRKLLIASALMILIYPNLNGYRSYIIRDFGYWAFYLLSILVFIRYLKRPSLHLALYWSAAMLTAILFRTEGLVIYLLLPLFFLVYRDVPASTRLKYIAGLYGLLWLAIPLLAAAWLITPDELTGTASAWSKPVELAREMLLAVSSGLADKAEILRSHYLTFYSDGYAWAIVIFTLLIILLTEAASAIGLLFSGLFVHAIYQKLAFPVNHIRSLLYYLVLINILILALFVLTQGFLAGRYPVALTLTVMMAAPFSLVAIHEKWKTRTGTSTTDRFAFPVVAVLIAYMAIDGMVSFGASKAYIEQAGSWLRENTLESETVFSIDSALLFEAGKLDFDDYLAQRKAMTADRLALKKTDIFEVLGNDRWKTYNYLAIRISRKHPEQEETVLKIVGKTPVQIFSNKRGDRVLIFSLSK